MTDTHGDPTDNLLWIIFKDFVLDITDPAGKMLAQAVPEKWKSKLDEWVAQNPQYAPHIVPVLKRGTRVAAQRLVNVSRLFRGALPQDSVQALEHVFDDALNHVLRSAEKYLSDPSAATRATSGTSLASGEGMSIIEEEGVSVIHARRSCPRFQRAFGKKVSVPVPDDKNQPSGDKKKGGQKPRFELRDPVVTTATPEEAAKLLEMSGFKTCRICESGKLIQETRTMAAPHRARGNTFREQFYKLAEEVASELTEAEREMFDEEITAFMAVPHNFFYLERFREFTGAFTDKDVRLLFHLPGKPVQKDFKADQVVGDFWIVVKKVGESMQATPEEYDRLVHAIQSHRVTAAQQDSFDLFLASRGAWSEEGVKSFFAQDASLRTRAIRALSLARITDVARAEAQHVKDVARFEAEVRKVRERRETLLLDAHRKLESREAEKKQKEAEEKQKHDREKAAKLNASYESAIRMCEAAGLSRAEAEASVTKPSHHQPTH